VSGQFPIGTADDVRVRFVDSDDGALSILEIENPREHEVFADVRQVLHQVGVQVVNIEVRADEERMVGRLHLTELDGSPIASERHLDIQEQVLQVVLGQATLHSTKPPPVESAAS
jgi:UTP:GlnB (protein PII) uridylyltransferase